MKLRQNIKSTVNSFVKDFVSVVAFVSFVTMFGSVEKGHDVHKALSGHKEHKAIKDTFRIVFADDH